MAITPDEFVDLCSKLLKLGATEVRAGEYSAALMPHGPAPQPPRRGWRGIHAEDLEDLGLPVPKDD